MARQNSHIRSIIDTMGDTMGKALLVFLMLTFFLAHTIAAANPLFLLSSGVSAFQLLAVSALISAVAVVGILAVILFQILFQKEEPKGGAGYYQGQVIRRGEGSSSSQPNPLASKPTTSPLSATPDSSASAQSCFSFEAREPSAPSAPSARSAS